MLIIPTYFRASRRYMSREYMMTVNGVAFIVSYSLIIYNIGKTTIVDDGKCTYYVKHKPSDVKFVSSYDSDLIKVKYNIRRLRYCLSVTINTDEEYISVDTKATRQLIPVRGGNNINGNRYDCIFEDIGGMPPFTRSLDIGYNVYLPAPLFITGGKCYQICRSQKDRIINY